MLYRLEWEHIWPDNCREVEAVTLDADDEEVVGITNLDGENLDEAALADVAECIQDNIGLVGSFEKFLADHKAEPLFDALVEIRYETGATEYVHKLVAAPTQQEAVAKAQAWLYTESQWAIRTDALRNVVECELAESLDG
jgi:hypothetical protein